MFLHLCMQQKAVVIYIPKADVNMLSDAKYDIT